MTTLRGALQGVFFLPCKVACLHGVVTLFSFLTLQIEFPYFAAFMVSCLEWAEPATRTGSHDVMASMHSTLLLEKLHGFAAHPFEHPHLPHTQPATTRQRTSYAS